MEASEVKVADGLPTQCFVVTPGTDDLVLIKCGESGYHSVDANYFKRGLSETPKAAAKRLNRGIGVTKAQAAAMLAGSVCGWHVRAADPANWSEDGVSLKR